MLFGRKNPLKSKLGYKIGRVADIIGKKTMSTIDNLAPIAAAAAPQYAPAIMAAAESAHGIDRAIRSGVSVANPRAGQSSAGNMIQFGNDVARANEEQQRLKKQTALLRQ